MDDILKSVQAVRGHVKTLDMKDTFVKVVSFPPFQAGVALGVGCSSVLFAHSFYLYKSGFYAARRFLLGFIVVTPMSTSMYIKRHEEKAAMLSAHMRNNGIRKMPSSDTKKY